MAVSQRSAPEAALDELYRRPGFLIRRAQQIAVSLFLEESGALGITNTQYGILMVLKHRPGTDQISLAKLHERHRRHCDHRRRDRWSCARARAAWARGEIARL